MLDPRDPVIGEWDVAVVGPHFTASLVARDLGDDGPDAERRFEFVLSHDRELTIAVANSLMSPIWPEPRTTDLPAIHGPARIALPRMRTPLADALTGLTAGASALPTGVADLCGGGDRVPPRSTCRRTCCTGPWSGHHRHHHRRRPREGPAAGVGEPGVRPADQLPPGDR